jgi:integrase
MSSYNIKVHELQSRADRKGRPWRLRWTVDSRRFERRYVTKALADNFRAKLLRAMRAGEPFDEATGLPESEVRARMKVTWYEHARAYAEMKWPAAAAKSRKAMVEALVTVTTALVVPGKVYADPNTLRRALFVAFRFNHGGALTLPPDLVQPLQWIEGNSLPLIKLRDSDTARLALNACARKLDGTPAAATTTSRKRAVFYNALGYAIERDLLEYNPVDKVQWRAPAVAERIDRRVVASTAQVEQLLAAAPAVHRRGGHLVAFFGCLYYAGMRPSEAASLRADDCMLPRKGWGRLVLVETAPHAGRDWTDDGEVRDPHGLKHRAQGETRRVPIPPELVRLLRQHINTYGTASDGRLFRAARGGHLSEAEYGRVWKAARKVVFSSAQVASPLAGRPYDLRHAAVTLWLNGGVPAPEVAARVGHGVEVLLRVYAGCIDGEETVVNARIEQALRASRGQGPDRGRVA